MDVDENLVDWFNLDDVDANTVDCVNGYIREAQQLFADVEHQQEYYNIPTLVNYICMKYCAVLEKFTVCGDAGQIQGKQRNILQSTFAKWCSAFGNVPLKFDNAAPMLYEWKFKANYPELKGMLASDSSCTPLYVFLHSDRLDSVRYLGWQ